MRLSGGTGAFLVREFLTGSAHAQSAATVGKSSVRWLYAAAKWLSVTGEVALKARADGSVTAAYTDVKTVQSCLGHSTPVTTLQIYLHTFQQAQARAMNAIAEALPIGTDSGNNEIRIA